jgi:hypothetical protein
MTYHASGLREITDVPITYQYGPSYEGDVLLILGVNGLITRWNPNGGAWNYWGYIENHHPDVLAKDKMPMGKGVLVITNRNPLTNAEEIPVYVPPPNQGN